jgi:hypothetical protein
VVAVRSEFEITGEGVQAQVAFLLLGSVAADAMILEEGLERLRGADGAG